MKRILDIGDLGATYVEHDTPIVKPPIYKPKPTPGGSSIPSPYVDPPPSWTPPDPNRPQPSPRPPRPNPAPPSPAPSPPPSPNPAPPVPPSPEAPPRAPESNALPWVIGAMTLLVAGSFAWAIRHAHTPEDVR